MLSWVNHSRKPLSSIWVNKTLLYHDIQMYIYISACWMIWFNVQLMCTLLPSNIWGILDIVICKHFVSKYNSAFDYKMKWRIGGTKYKNIKLAFFHYYYLSQFSWLMFLYQYIHILIYNAYTIKSSNNIERAEISGLGLNEWPFLIKDPHFLTELVIKRGK